VYKLRADRVSDGVIRLIGNLDQGSGGDLGVRVLARSDPDDPIVADLRDVVTSDTVGVSASLRLAKAVEPAGIVPRTGPPNLTRILRVVALYEFALNSDVSATGRVPTAIANVCTRSIELSEEARASRCGTSAIRRPIDGDRLVHGAFPIRFDRRPSVTNH
jgi:hypothetical protein